MYQVGINIGIIMIGDFKAHSSKWGYKDTNAAGKEMEELLNTSTLQLIYCIMTQIHPYTFILLEPKLRRIFCLYLATSVRTRNASYLTTLDLDISLWLPKYRSPGNKGYSILIKEPPGTSKRLNGESSHMLEINLHYERIDFSQHPDKIGTVINSSIIDCAKACVPRVKSEQIQKLLDRRPWNSQEPKRIPEKRGWTHW